MIFFYNPGIENYFLFMSQTAVAVKKKKKKKKIGAFEYTKIIKF